MDFPHFLFVIILINIPLNKCYIQEMYKLNNDNDLQCYVCNSLLDKTCDDPFNITSTLLRPCSGQCVKKVAQLNNLSTKYTIIRSCSTLITIPFRSLDWSCAEFNDGTRRDYYCFCSTHGCNRGGIVTPSNSFVVYLFLNILLIHFTNY
ncbi:hypothetical protein SNEBB_002607 [Seison nebaliae]|nr:hypothetical protein SNEBB_002607 [Seison nebaliae]